MTIDKPNLAHSQEPEGHKQLDSHVQSPPPIYGEPKGPIPGALFQDSDAKNPPDRERNGFVSGRDVVSRGDLVGSGPEEWEHDSRRLTGEEKNTQPASEDDTAAND